MTPANRMDVTPASFVTQYDTAPVFSAPVDSTASVQSHRWLLHLQIVAPCTVDAPPLADGANWLIVPNLSVAMKTIPIETVAVYFCIY